MIYGYELCAYEHGSRLFRERYVSMFDALDRVAQLLRNLNILNIFYNWKEQPTKAFGKEYHKRIVFKSDFIPFSMTLKKLQKGDLDFIRLKNIIYMVGEKYGL